MEQHWKKKNIWPRGNLNPRRWCQSTDMLAQMLSIKPRVKQHCLSHSSNVNSNIVTDAVFVM